MLGDPREPLGHERLEDRSRELAVVPRRERVADVVEQAHGDVVVVASVAARTRVADCNECSRREIA